MVHVVREKQPQQPCRPQRRPRRGQRRRRIRDRPVFQHRAQTQQRLQDGDRRQHPQHRILDGEAPRDRRAEERRLHGGDQVSVAPRGIAQRRRRVVQRRCGGAGRPIRRRGAEEIAVGLPGGEAGEVARELLQQIEAPAGIAAVQRDIGILAPVQVVVVQPVQDTVGAHRDARRRREAAAHRVVEPARLVEPVVRRVVGKYEQRVLPRGDEDGRGRDGERMPPRERRRHRRRDRADGPGDGERRARRVEPAQASDRVGQQRAGAPAVVAKLAPGRRFVHAARPAPLRDRAAAPWNATAVMRRR